MKSRRYIFNIFTFSIALVFLFKMPSNALNRKISFSTGWKFYQGNTSGAENSSYDDNLWENVCLPHTVKVENDPAPSNYYSGICWYRKTFTLESSYNGKTIYIEFEGAMQKVEVWLNDKKLIEFKGGYTPFVLDITDELNLSGSNTIAVKLDNRNNTEIPPGNSDPDFSYYGGLNRYVNLYVLDPLHISHPLLEDIPGGGGIFVTYSNVSTSSATINIKTHVINETGNAKNCDLNTIIKDKNGGVVGESSSSASITGSYTFSQQIQLSSPKLWSPSNPYLYTLSAQVLDNDAIVDNQEIIIGIRTISFSKNGGFTLNESRIKWMGANRHQEYPYIGNAVPKSGQIRDAKMIREAGFNFVRMSHYIQPESFVEACSKFGLMSMACVPGWQYFNSSSNQFKDLMIRDVRAMIRMYRNYPSVIVWEIVPNESSYPDDFIQRSMDAAHEEYPGNQMYGCGEGNDNILDIYISSSQHGVRDYSGSKACIISEYGDWEYGGMSSSSRVTREDGENAMLTQYENHLEALNLNRGVSWLTGDALWVMFDYNGFVALIAGIVDFYRVPKFSYYFYRSQHDPGLEIEGVNTGPMVKIASNWISGSSGNVLVFSNCEQVKLYKDGDVIGTQSPESGSAYQNIPNPPFKFNLGSFQPGELKAEGLIGGQVRATDIVRTGGSASSISIKIDTAGIPLQADGSDIALVYAYILDDNNSLVVTAKNSVSFSVSGPGKLLGPNPQNAHAGIAMIYLQTTQNSGVVIVSASSSNLGSDEGSVTINEAAVVTKDFQLYYGNRKYKNQEVRICQNNRFVSFNIPQSELKKVKHVNLSVYNVLGKKIRQWNLKPSEITTVNLEILAKGVYFIQLKMGNLKYTHKLLLKSL